MSGVFLLGFFVNFSALAVVVFFWLRFKCGETTAERNFDPKIRNFYLEVSQSPPVFRWMEMVISKHFPNIYKVLEPSN